MEPLMSLANQGGRCAPVARSIRIEVQEFGPYALGLF